MKADIIAMCVTVLLAVGIIIAGYQGITYVGKEIIKSDTEISMVDEDKKLKYMFYSETDEQIQVFPWNYENQENAKIIETKEYEVIINTGVADNLRELIMNYVCKQLDLSDKEYKALYKKIKPRRKDFQQIQVSVYEQSHIFYYYKKEVSVKEGNNYIIKYVLGDWGTSLIAFYCEPVKEEGEKESQLKEEQIIPKLNQQAEQIVNIVNFMQNWKVMCDGSIMAELSVIFEMDGYVPEASSSVDGIYEEEKKKETYQGEGYAKEEEETMNSEEERRKVSEQILSEYQILVLSDRILVIAEEQKVILQYSRKDCQLIGFSLN